VIAGALALTVTVVDWVVAPPAPVHVSSNSVVFESFPVDQSPVVLTGPCQPPLAVQAVASVAIQWSVATPWSETVVGVAVSVIEGAPAPACTVTAADPAADPPCPVHVSV
jgi:hypothetical protein